MMAFFGSAAKDSLVSTKRLAVFALLAAASASAFAADLPTLPSTAAKQPAEPDWSGLYVGSGVSLSAAKGVKGQVGGDVFAGYDHVFINGVVLGARFDTGYNPWQLSNHARGFDFAEGSVNLGYEMGRFTPYITAGVGLAKTTSFGSGLPNASNSLNALFNGPGAVQPVTSVGVGLDYAVTNNVHVGVGAYVSNGGGLQR
jgi:opacity protein-like surface antigen